MRLVIQVVSDGAEAYLDGFVGMTVSLAAPKRLGPHRIGVDTPPALAWSASGGSGVDDPEGRHRYPTGDDRPEHDRVFASSDALDEVALPEGDIEQCPGHEQHGEDPHLFGERGRPQYGQTDDGGLDTGALEGLGCTPHTDTSSVLRGRPTSGTVRTGGTSAPWS